MRNPYSFAPQSRSCVLILAALCAVLAAAPGLAATAPQTPASFLASLSSDPPPAVSGAAQLPSTGARFLSDGSCSTSADCPTGQICCFGGTIPADDPPIGACLPRCPKGVA